ncbi:MAG: hypothetical protein J3K34DRAFT_405501 [Monoraphidium minutum]|nr:MAG: hypothetical protein J3K34DRAFT_405501 [Monoraphidium minutum]
MTELMYRDEYAMLGPDDLLKTACHLRNELEQERKRSNSYAESLKLAKEQSLAAQKQVEQEEEFITNKLMKRLEQLKREKQALATEVEQEEEMITNTLQKKLEKLNRDKVALENQLEAEQEYITHRLQKQVGGRGGRHPGFQCFQWRAPGASWLAQTLCGKAPSGAAAGAHGYASPSVHAHTHKHTHTHTNTHTHIHIHTNTLLPGGAAGEREGGAAAGAQ